MASAGEKSLAVGHIPGFQIDPKERLPPAIVLFLFAARRTAPLFYDRGQKRSITPDKIEGNRLPGYYRQHRKRHITRFDRLQGQHRAIASSSLSRLFAPLTQKKKWEIHTVFLHFRNFELGQKFWLRLLAELCGVAQGKLRSELCESIPHSKTPRRRRYCAAGVSLLLFHQIGQRHAV